MHQKYAHKRWTSPVKNEYRLRLNETFKRNYSAEFWCMPSENVTRSERCIAMLPTESTDLFHKLNKKIKLIF